MTDVAFDTLLAIATSTSYTQKTFARRTKTRIATVAAVVDLLTLAVPAPESVFVGALDLAVSLALRTRTLVLTTDRQQQDGGKYGKQSPFHFPSPFVRRAFRARR